MKKLAAVFAALSLAMGLAACTPTDSAPAPPSAEASPTTPPLTDKQKHIVEDAFKALEAGDYSEEGLKEFIIADEGYSVEDVTAAVNSIACNFDWNAEAEAKAKTYGLEDKEAIKSRLRDDGFTEAQAEYGVNPVPQNT